MYKMSCLTVREQQHEASVLLPTTVLCIGCRSSHACSILQGPPERNSQVLLRAGQQHGRVIGWTDALVGAQCTDLQ